MDQAWPPSWNGDWKVFLDVAVSTGFIALITTILRFIARKRKTTRTGRKEGLYWDDWLLLPAAVQEKANAWNAPLAYDAHRSLPSQLTAPVFMVGRATI